MTHGKYNGTAMPDWFQTAKLGMRLKAKTSFTVPAQNEEQRRFFGYKVDVSCIGSGRLVEKGGDTVTVLLEEGMKSYRGKVPGKLVTTNPSKFEPVE